MCTLLNSHTFVLKTGEISQKIREFINRSRFLYPTGARWSQMCSCLDFLRDIDDSLILDTDGNLSLVLVFGILEALYVKQNAVEHLCKGVFEIHNTGKKLSNNKTLQSIRNIRNLVAAHGTHTSKGMKYRLMSDGKGEPKEGEIVFDVTADDIVVKARGEDNFSLPKTDPIYNVVMAANRRKVFDGEEIKKLRKSSLQNGGYVQFITNDLRGKSLSNDSNLSYNVIHYPLDKKNKVDDACGILEAYKFEDFNLLDIIKKQDCELHTHLEKLYSKLVADEKNKNDELKTRFSELKHDLDCVISELNINAFQLTQHNDILCEKIKKIFSFLSLHGYEYIYDYSESTLERALNILCGYVEFNKEMVPVVRFEKDDLCVFERQVCELCDLLILPKLKDEDEKRACSYCLGKIVEKVFPLLHLSEIKGIIRKNELDCDDILYPLEKIRAYYETPYKIYVDESDITIYRQYMLRIFQRTLKELGEVEKPE